MGEFKPNTLLPVSVSRDELFKAWFEFLFPCHKLSAKEQLIAVEYIKVYFELKKSIPDDLALITKVLKSVDTKRDISAKVGIKLNNLELYKVKLRKAGFLRADGSIDPVFIPSMEGVSKMYTLLVVFKLTDEEPKLISIELSLQVD